MATYLSDCKYGIGPVSKNVVDACITYTNHVDRPLILIASRNQIDYDGGYVGWDTRTFFGEVRTRSPKIFLARDHGGPAQGPSPDNWTLSFRQDCRYFDVIHLDPWKVASSFEDGCKRTAELVSYCYFLNPSVLYEVGTEEAIFKYEAKQLDKLLSYLKKNLTADEFSRIYFAVIQGGTSLGGNTNTGQFNRDRLLEMVAVCRKHSVHAKTHNCDYLSAELLLKTLGDGVDAINLAPEFGYIETKTYLDEIGSGPIFDAYYKLCLDSGRWKRWLGPQPPANQQDLILSCGHYVINTPIFQNQIKAKLKKEIDTVVRGNIIKRLKELHGD